MRPRIPGLWCLQKPWGESRKSWCRQVWRRERRLRSRGPLADTRKGHRVIKPSGDSRELTAAGGQGEREGAVLTGSYREGAAQAVTPLPPLELSRQEEPSPGPGCLPTCSSSRIQLEGLLGTLFRTLSWELFVPGGDWTPCPTFLPEVFPASTPRPQLLILCSSTWQFLQVVLGHLSGTGFRAAKKPSRSPLPLRSSLSRAPFAARLQLSPPVPWHCVGTLLLVPDLLPSTVRSPPGCGPEWALSNCLGQLLPVPGAPHPPGFVLSP